jgi:hypothetical protein
MEMCVSVCSVGSLSGKLSSASRSSLLCSLSQIGRRARLSLGARSMLDARSFMISTLRSQVGFAAAVAHARLRLSRLELIGGSGRTAGRYASAARAFISPTAFEQARGRRGEALWERVEAGSGSLGAASSESAAGSGRLRACGC